MVVCFIHQRNGRAFRIYVLAEIIMKNHLIVTIFLFIFSCGVSANMTVYPMAMKMIGNEKSAETLRITSQSDQTQYIRVVVKQVLHPATAQEQEVEVQHWQGSGIVVSPAKFALPAGTTKTVRAIGLAPAKSEQVFRAYFEPVAAPEKSDEIKSSNAQASVSFSLIWGVLIRQLPAEPQVKLSYSAAAIKNSGNIRVSLEKYSFCESGRKDVDCHWKSIGKNLYPNEELKIDVMKTALPLRVQYRDEADKSTTLNL